MAQHIDLRARIRAAVWLAVLAGFFSWIPNAAAQTTGAAVRPVSFGVAGGLNVARLSLPINIFDEADLGLEVDNSSRLGFIGGLLTELPLSRNVTFDTGAFFSTRGTAMKLTVPGLGTAEADLRILYLDFPVQVRVPVVRSRNATLGVLGGAMIAARLHARGHASFAGQSMDETFTDEIAPVDVGLTFGGRVDGGRALIIAQYLLGLVDTSRGDAADPVRHRLFSVMAGWRF